MDFSKIIFKKDQMGEWKSRTHFQNGYSMSVIAGQMAYCNPRQNLEDPQEYLTYEIAIFNEDDDFVTQRFTDEANDDVCGWLTKDEINEIMQKVAQYEWDESHALDQVMNKMIEDLEEDGEEV
jgi:hypothetical protein